MDDSNRSEFRRYLGLVGKNVNLWKPPMTSDGPEAAAFLNHIIEGLADPARQYDMLMQLLTLTSLGAQAPIWTEIQWHDNQMLYKTYGAEGSVYLGSTNFGHCAPGYKLSRLCVIGGKICWIESRELENKSYEMRLVVNNERGQPYCEMDHLCEVQGQPCYVAKTRIDDPAGVLYETCVVTGTTEGKKYWYITEFQIHEGKPCYVAQTKNVVYVIWGDTVLGSGEAHYGTGNLFPHKDSLLYVIRHTREYEPRLCEAYHARGGTSLKILAEAPYIYAPVMADGELAYAYGNDTLTTVSWRGTLRNVEGRLRPWNSFNFRSDVAGRNVREVPLLTFATETLDGQYSIWVNLVTIDTWDHWKHHDILFDLKTLTLAIKSNGNTLEYFEPKTYNLKELGIL